MAYLRILAQGRLIGDLPVPETKLKKKMQTENFYQMDIFTCVLLMCQPYRPVLRGWKHGYADSPSILHSNGITP